ncbi:MAG TPA: M1 family metallopeptidase [Gemmatimonadaceae bacterium]|nr:M1 family metallopeptidase [Gemmatimonadaceae bacterium]
MPSALPLLLALQGIVATSPTTPPGGDTVGYWQQRVHYRIQATLEEAATRLTATGVLTYVNNSPDTLRVMYVHQYLNAFRPGSKWSAADEREGRVRFQRLREPDHAYERFTAPVTVRSRGATPTVVPVEYPGAPDSTVARFVLPRPLSPGDSVEVRFAWEARPSTLPRRQGRRGRHWDFAQWYPKVAVYDRLGWQANPLVPAGEFYGEFGTYDVTLTIAPDQVVAATGVPVEGDPGYGRAARWGTPHATAGAYGPGPAATTSPGPGAPDDARAPTPGMRRVRFLARDVHHFAWSTSPDYRYEGGTYVRAARPRSRLTTWDTVAIHVLYRAGDEGQWGNGQAVERTRVALAWLEHVYGPYAYPQVTNLHRLDGGGTEFPMMMMNGSASQGLILHEGGHIFTYGILANNEWRSGWLDEGLTSYQTSWREGATLHDRAARADSGPLAQAKPPGYRGRAVRPDAAEAQQLEQFRLDLVGRAEPLGTLAHEYNEFAVYNAMIYDRAERMYGALRDVMGDSAFAAFLRGYYARWALRHVDEAAMRAEAERAHGADLGWFFDQWVRRAGLVDYDLRRVRVRREAEGWVTTAEVLQRGAYSHPMPVGIRSGEGWTLVRLDPLLPRQGIRIRTAARPREVRLDPRRTTEDWNQTNDVRGRPDFLELLPARAFGWPRRPPSRDVFDWPFLDHYDRGRWVVAWTPLVWASKEGDATAAMRWRSNYQNWWRTEIGMGLAKWPDATDLRDVTVWARSSNPPARGSWAGARTDWWYLEHGGGVRLERLQDRSRFLLSAGARRTAGWGLQFQLPRYDPARLPEQWSGAKTGELYVVDSLRWRNGWSLRWTAAAGGAYSLLGSAETARRGHFDPFGRGELDVRHLRTWQNGRMATLVRGFAGGATGAPPQRRVFASSLDPTQTMFTHWWRPRGAILKRAGVNFVPLGGAGLRAYSPNYAPDAIAAVNLEHALRLAPLDRVLPRGLGLWVSAFGDAALTTERRPAGDATEGIRLADAGVGLSLRGRLFDRDVRLRVDLPFWVSEPSLALDRHGRDERGAWRYGVALTDFW